MSPLRRLWNVVRRSRMDDDLRQELDTHVALIEEEERRHGLTADQARRNARARFGNPHAYRERALDAVIATWFEHACKDVRFAARTLRRAPAFTAVALLTLALGIGANTAIFSIVNGVLLRPLDYPRPEQLMYVTTQFAELGLGQFPLSAPEYLELREVNRSFAAMGAFSPGAGEVNLTAPGGARRVRNANVDEHLLDALGLQAAQGRLFARGETDRIESCRHRCRRSLFSRTSCGKPRLADSRSSGKLVEVNSRPREVIGIMPPGADVLDIRPEIWLPLGLNPSNRGNRRRSLPPRDRPVEGRRHARGSPDGTDDAQRTLGRACRRQRSHVRPCQGCRGAGVESRRGHILQMATAPRSDRRALPAGRSGCFRRPPGWCC